MADEEIFDLQQFLTNTTFTIPVTLEDRRNGKVVKRVAKVTYDFNDEMSKELEGEEIKDADGKVILNERGRPKKIPASMNKQLATMVKAIDGVEVAPTEEFWSSVTLRYRATILQTILADIYPKDLTSKV